MSAARTSNRRLSTSSLFFFDLSSCDDRGEPRVLVELGLLRRHRDRHQDLGARRQLGRDLGLGAAEQERTDQARERAARALVVIALDRHAEPRAKLIPAAEQAREHDARTATTARRGDSRAACPIARSGTPRVNIRAAFARSVRGFLIACASSTTSVANAMLRELLGVAREQAVADDQDVLLA